MGYFKGFISEEGCRKPGFSPAKITGLLKFFLVDSKTNSATFECYGLFHSLGDGRQWVNGLET